MQPQAATAFPRQGPARRAYDLAEGNSTCLDTTKRGDFRCTAAPSTSKTRTSRTDHLRQEVKASPLLRMGSRQDQARASGRELARRACVLLANLRLHERRLRSSPLSHKLKWRRHLLATAANLQPVVGRVTPCAPIVNSRRRSEDCPPYQVETRI